MVAHALTREAKTFIETTFGTPPADWTASGSRVLVIEPNIESVAQANVENENIRGETLDPYDRIHTLRSGGTVSFASYLHSSPVNAAEAATATVTAFPLADMMLVALGGRDLGLAIGLAGGSAAAPEVDDQTGLAVGDWQFFYDTSGGTGRFQRIIALPGADVLTLDRDLPFTPDAGGADVAHAVIECYLHELSITDHTHAQHKTLSMLVQGRGSEDAIDMSGVKLAASIEPITEGEPCRVSFEGMVTTFRSDGFAKPTLTGTEYGEAGLVPGIGRTTTFEIAEVGDPLTNTGVLIRGPITVKVGITWESDSSPAGLEGRNGYVATGFGETGLEFTVDYDKSWVEAYRAGTHYHVLIQVGNTPAGAMGFYFPNLEIIEEPVRVDVGGITSCKVVMAAHMDTHPDAQIDHTTLSGDTRYKAVAPLQVLFVA